jgi:hypothetical protein
MMVNHYILFMFNFEKMPKSIVEITLELIEKYISKDGSSNVKEIMKKYLDERCVLKKEIEIIYKQLFQDAIAKHRRGEPLSHEELIIIARRVVPLLTRSEMTTVSMEFLNACRDLLFASSEADFEQKQTALIKLILEEIEHIPFHQKNSEEKVFQIRNHMIEHRKITEQADIIKYTFVITLLVKFYNRHFENNMNRELLAYRGNFDIYLLPYLDRDDMICFPLFGNGHDKYQTIMYSHRHKFPFLKCSLCNLGPNEYTSIENLVVIIAKEGIRCTCWEKFVKDNPGRNIFPCSAKGLDGSLCRFCFEYKDMKFLEIICLLNDSFKNGSLKEAVYNDLFDTICQIIIGGSDMPVMPLTSKLVFYLLSMSIELFQDLLSLIEKFEVFFRRIKSIPRPNFLSTPNLHDFTKADYQAYMDELKLGQDQFETVIPKFGFCCCNENSKSRDEFNT